MEAVKIANELFKNDKFQTHKQLEHKLELMKLEFRSRMGEEKRREFSSHNLVFKYIKNQIYEVDKLGMNEMLHQYGLLVNAARIELKKDDKERKADAFTNPQTFHLRINSKVEKEEYDFTKYGMERLMDDYNRDHSEYKQLDWQIEKAKTKMFKCEKLQKDKSGTFDYGTLTLARNKLTYDIGAIYENLGLQYLIENATPNAEKLEEYMIKGFINKSEVYQFKKLTDIRLKFVVISLSDEKIVFGMMNRKTQGFIREALAEVAETTEA